MQSNGNSTHARHSANKNMRQSKKTAKSSAEPEVHFQKQFQVPRTPYFADIELRNLQVIIKKTNLPKFLQIQYLILGSVWSSFLHMITNLKFCWEVQLCRTLSSLFGLSQIFLFAEWWTWADFPYSCKREVRKLFFTRNIQQSVFLWGF